MKNLHLIPTDKPSKLHLGHLGLVLCGFNYGLNTINGQHIYITSDEKIKEEDWVINLKSNKVYSIFILNEVVDYEKKIILTTDPDLIKYGVQAIDDNFLEWFVKNPSCEEVEVKLENYYASGALQPNLWQHKIIIPKEEPKQIYYNTVGIENGVNVVKGQFNTQKEALDLANELNRKFPDLYYDWRETLIKEEPKQETLEEAAESYCEKVWGGYKDDVFKHDDIITDKTLSEISKKDFTEGAKWQQERMYSEEEVFTMCRAFATFVQRNAPSYKKQQEWFEQFKKK